MSEELTNRADDLALRCQEVLAWRKTGILEGEALRTMAREIKGKLQTSMGEALSIAENQTLKEAAISLSRQLSQTMSLTIAAMHHRCDAPKLTHPGMSA